MKTRNQKLKESYDETPYISQPIQDSHPAHLQAVCQLVGLKTPDYRKAKVLEIGCSLGGNIIPMAMYNPNMNIIGIDISSVQINEGNKVIESVGLTNIKLIEQDISTYDVPENHFDYIICHGVFSWVPNEVRESILQVIQKGLKDDGVAYVSYNTYPGWKEKEIYRDAMMFAAQKGQNNEEKYRLAMDVIDFIDKNRIKNSFSKCLGVDESYIKNKDQKFYVIHDFLSSYNTPFYFKDFINLCTKNNLKYICESEIGLHFKKRYIFDNYFEKTNNVLYDDVIEQEQLKDFITNTSFRKTIITKSTNLSKYNINYSNLLEIDMLNSLFILKGDESVIEEWKTIFVKNEVDRKIFEFILEKINDHGAVVKEMINEYKNIYSDDSIHCLYRIIIDFIIVNAIKIFPYEILEKKSVYC